jgi:hypothetical protein
MCLETYCVLEFYVESIQYFMSYKNFIGFLCRVYSGFYVKFFMSR